MVDKKPLIVKCFAVGIILLFVGVTLAQAMAQNTEKQSTSRGNWLYVGGSGPGNYTQIQDAINNASDGDIIIIFNNIYKESILLSKQLYLIGINQPTIEGVSQNVIQISNDNCILDNLKITNEFQQINIESNHNTIRNCSINCSILLQNALENYFINNEVTICGFRVTGNSNHNFFSENDIKDIKTSIYTYGIEIADSHYNLIINNTLTNIWRGVYLNNANYTTVINNRFFGCEITITGHLLSNYNTHTIQGNTVGDKKIYYYKNTNDLTIPEDAGQIFLVNCSNCIIKNYNVNKNHFFINLFYSSHNLITNNTMQNNSHYYYTIPTIYIYESDQNNIYQNTFINCDFSVLLYNSVKNTIDKNTIKRGAIYFTSNISGQNKYNIISSNTLFGRSNIHVSGNTNIIRNNILNDSGINIWGIFNFIMNNEVKKTDDGISIYSGGANRINHNKVVECERGIWDMCGGNIYRENVVEHNKIGLYLRYGNNRIERNNINDNDLGIYLEGGRNKIINNNLILNLLDLSFQQSLINFCLNNYWGLPLFLPKIIPGTYTFYGMNGEPIKEIDCFIIDFRPRILPVIFN